jgi:hypothetical protein
VYRCGVCGACSKPGQARRVYVIERVVPVVRAWVGSPPDARGATRTEIEREVPLCEACDAELQAGTPFHELAARHRASPPAVVLRPPPSFNQPVLLRDRPKT